MLILVVSSVITNHPFETVLLWTTDLEKSITRIKFYIIRTSGSSAEAFCDAHPWADHLAKLEVMVLTEQDWKEPVSAFPKAKNSRFCWSIPRSRSQPSLDSQPHSL